MRRGASLRDFDNIPKVMKDLDHWVLWKQEVIAGKLSKIPYQTNDRKAMSNNPDTWTSFDNVVQCFYEKPYDGIGFQLSWSGITGIDLDHCIEDVLISSHAQEIISQCSSYTEISPSRTGIHIYVQGTVPLSVHTKAIEIYSAGRYLTVTGDKLNDLNVEPRQGVLDQLHKKYAKVNLVQDTFTSAVGIDQEPRQSDDEILERLFKSLNGSKIKALYEGDLGKYESNSEADLALCGYLAFWLDGDFNRIDRAFKNSGLYRDKWNRQSYKQLTINKAISGHHQSLRTPPRMTIEKEKTNMKKQI